MWDLIIAQSLIFVSLLLASGEVEGHAGQAEPDFKLPKIRFFEIEEINFPS